MFGAGSANVRFGAGSEVAGLGGKLGEADIHRVGANVATGPELPLVTARVVR